MLNRGNFYKEEEKLITTLCNDYYLVVIHLCFICDNMGNAFLI